MFKILEKQCLNSTVTKMVIEAPLIAKKAKAGQFVILNVEEDGERIPLTIADYDRDLGTVTIIYQIVGATTFLLNKKNAGDYIPHFAGPLGNPTEINNEQNICIIGGGVGCAIAMPVAKAFGQNGAKVTSIIGFRTKDLVICEEEFKSVSDDFFIVTDDGSYGSKGNVCMPLSELLKNGSTFDRVIAIGPLVMMKYVVAAVKPYDIPCTVSMNPIMIDGTGMCGGCRLTLNENGKKITRFACVDGPDFDGYAIDFDEAMSRGTIYKEFEKHSYEKTCNLIKMGD